jgi:hypothetical protein
MLIGLFADNNGEIVLGGAAGLVGAIVYLAVARSQTETFETAMEVWTNSAMCMHCGTVQRLTKEQKKLLALESA